jgi:hypothetical protein
MALPILQDPAVLPLAFGLLPATKRTQAIRLLAVPLVPATWLVGLLAALAEASPRPQTPIASSRNTPIESILVLSHGSWCPLGPARGGSGKLPRALSCHGVSPSGIHPPTTLSVYADQSPIAINGPTEGEGNAAVGAASVLSEVDGEGNIHIDVGKQRKETSKMKETRKDTTEVVAA